MPTDFFDAERIITERWQAQTFASIDAELYDNTTEPDLEANDSVQVYARVTVIPVDSTQASLGDSTSRHERHVGLLEVQLFGRRGQWTKPLLDAADAVSAAFRGVTDNGVIFETPQIVKLGARSQTWYQLNVTIPYRWDGYYT
jgi:hypothetical protein